MHYAKQRKVSDFKLHKRMPDLKVLADPKAEDLNLERINPTSKENLLSQLQKQLLMFKEQ